MSRLTRAWREHHKENRFLVGTFLVVLALSSGAFYLLQRAHAASPRELTNRLLLFVLWYLDVTLILVMLFVLLRSLIRLSLERRAGILGSRFRTKLVFTYVALTFIPVIFIFLIATNLLQSSIDRWFSAPVEEVLRGGAAMTGELRAMAEQRLQRQASSAARELARGVTPKKLESLHRLLGSGLLALYRGPRRLQAVTDARLLPRSPPPLKARELRQGTSRADRWRGGLLIRAWAPIPGTPDVVVVGDLLPREVLLHLERATAAYATFQQMKLQRGTVTGTTILVFLAMTLLLLFATVWIGLYLSRRFTEPLLAVAEATQRVAAGNKLEEVTVPASDEVAVLVSSFNAMVRRVRATEEEILASNQELSTLLATIPTGVLTLDGERRRVRPNPAAARLLGVPEWAGTWRELVELSGEGLVPLRESLARLTAGQVRQVDLEINGVTRHVELTAEPLRGGGWVVAMDDLTQLLSAQRQAAWSEVARRIAHEIKNPLTPIRLAAERIQRRSAEMEGPVRDVIVNGCNAIIAHVAGLKELVDAFHRYARMPSVNPRPVPLRQLLDETVALYRGLRRGVAVELEAPEAPLMARVDPVLLRQALVNLLDNSFEVLGERGHVTIGVTLHEDDITIVVEDDGPGFPTEDLEVLVQPFFSTKGRGSGMGLALVHRVVADHGGRLAMENLRPRGARVRIELRDALVLEPGVKEQADEA
ncbi:MAG: HAMP domain-containing protein [Acidobacteria bacterium]|nr:HAMP domain-containing protein [Acidobacteriota bacterium]